MQIQRNDWRFRGTSFRMRSDLHLKLVITAKNAFDYAKEGGIIMIAHKWITSVALIR